MIDTKTVSPHSMFLKYLRDVAVSLREEPDKWFIRSDIIFNNIRDFSEEEFYGWINLTTKTLKIRQRSASDYGSSYQYDRIYEELAFNGLILKFSGPFFENGIPETILQTISQNILEGLSTVGEYEQEKTFFAEQEKIFKELDPFGQFSNFYNFRLLKDQRLLDIYSEFISEENIDNVLKDHPRFIADVIFSKKFGDSISTLEKLFSKQSILKSLVNLSEKDFDYFSLVDYPARMEELYKYLFEDENVPEETKNKLKPLFTKSFFECVKNDSLKYFTFGDRFTSLFSGDIEEFRNSHKENLQFYFEKSLHFLSEIEDDVVFNLYNDRAFNCFGAFEFILLKNKLGFHYQLSKNYNDIVIKSVLNLVDDSKTKNIKFIFSSGYNQMLNLLSGVSNFETNCNLEERSYRKEIDMLFCELGETFYSLSEIIPEDKQQKLNILQLELELYQKKFDLFYQNFE